MRRVARWPGSTDDTEIARTLLGHGVSHVRYLAVGGRRDADKAQDRVDFDRTGRHRHHSDQLDPNTPSASSHPAGWDGAQSQPVAVDPIAATAELVRTRAYAFSALGTVNDLVGGCTDALARYGFCVVDDVIPRDDVPRVRDEVNAAEAAIAGNVAAIRQLLDASPDNTRTVQALKAVLDNAPTGIELRPVRRTGRPPKPPNDIVWLPHYAPYLGHPAITAVARRVLDDHLKIAQLHLRPIAAAAGAAPGGFGTAKYRGRADTREWHTDWPPRSVRLWFGPGAAQRRVHPPTVPGRHHVPRDDLVSHRRGR